MEFLQGLNWDFIHNAIVLAAVLTAWAVPARMWRKQERTRQRERNEHSAALKNVLRRELETLGVESARIMGALAKQRLSPEGEESHVYKNPYKTGVAASFLLPASWLLEKPDTWCAHVKAHHAEMLTDIAVCKQTYTLHAEELKDENAYQMLAGEFAFMTGMLTSISERVEVLKAEM